MFNAFEGTRAKVAPKINQIARIRNPTIAHVRSVIIKRMVLGETDHRDDASIQTSRKAQNSTLEQPTEQARKCVRMRR